jgi:hypothetical protein
VTRRWLLLAVLVIVVGAVMWSGLFDHSTPAGQPPLAVMDLARLRADFNASADRTRVLVLLSPT